MCRKWDRASVQSNIQGNKEKWATCEGVLSEMGWSCERSRYCLRSRCLAEQDVGCAAESMWHRSAASKITASTYVETLHESDFGLILFYLFNLFIYQDMRGFSR